jgi:hypothetical protein
MRVKCKEKRGAESVPLNVQSEISTMNLFLLTEFTVVCTIIFMDYYIAWC